ncbi:MAG: hypothetical protein Tsb004_28120 [Allomuricauda sp.]
MIFSENQILQNPMQVFHNTAIDDTMKRTILIALFLLPLLSHAQNCDCESHFRWVKDTFEENDAGFTYALEQKGEYAYQVHNASFIKKIQDIQDADSCMATIRDWLTFFRIGHFYLGTSNPRKTNSNIKQPDREAIIKAFRHEEKFNLDVDVFKSSLSRKKTPDFEGIWFSAPYTVGIVKSGDDHIGFIIEGDGTYWSKNQVKLRIKKDSSAVYYMRDHSEQLFRSTKLLGKNYLQTGFVTFKRLLPTFEPDPKIERHMTSMLSKTPFVEMSDGHTAYLRIPSFDGTLKPVIDSVIRVNKDLILNHPNLIIDLRNNGGGSDRSYSEVLPILYTNPIRTIGTAYLSTPLNNNRMLDFINDPSYGMTTAEKKWAKESYEKLEEKRGQFVNLDSTTLELTRYDTIYPFPKKVGILINGNNGSTAEQFLLAAKQSQKVKLFGTTTAGVLDISNIHFVTSPCGDLTLGYSISKSMRIPYMAIDGKGIQPDYYIDSSIPDYQWIDFTQSILKTP